MTVAKSPVQARLESWSKPSISKDDIDKKLRRSEKLRTEFMKQRVGSAINDIQRVTLTRQIRKSELTIRNPEMERKKLQDMLEAASVRRTQRVNEIATKAAAEVVKVKTSVARMKRKTAESITVAKRANVEQLNAAAWRRNKCIQMRSRSAVRDIQRVSERINIRNEDNKSIESVLVKQMANATSRRSAILESSIAFAKRDTQRVETRLALHKENNTEHSFKVTEFSQKLQCRRNLKLKNIVFNVLKECKSELFFQLSRKNIKASSRELCVVGKSAKIHVKCGFSNVASFSKPSVASPVQLRLASWSRTPFTKKDLESKLRSASQRHQEFLAKHIASAVQDIKRVELTREIHRATTQLDKTNAEISKMKLSESLEAALLRRTFRMNAITSRVSERVKRVETSVARVKRKRDVELKEKHAAFRRRHEAALWRHQAFLEKRSQSASTAFSSTAAAVVDGKNVKPSKTKEEILEQLECATKRRDDLLKRSTAFAKKDSQRVERFISNYKNVKTGSPKSLKQQKELLRNIREQLELATARRDGLLEQSTAFATRYNRQVEERLAKRKRFLSSYPTPEDVNEMTRSKLQKQLHDAATRREEVLASSIAFAKRDIDRVDHRHNSASNGQFSNNESMKLRKQLEAAASRREANLKASAAFASKDVSRVSRAVEVRNHQSMNSNELKVALEKQVKDATFRREMQLKQRKNKASRHVKKAKKIYSDVKSEESLKRKYLVDNLDIRLEAAAAKRDAVLAERKQTALKDISRSKVVPIHAQEENKKMIALKAAAMKKRHNRAAAHRMDVQAAIVEKSFKKTAKCALIAKRRHQNKLKRSVGTSAMDFDKENVKEEDDIVIIPSNVSASEDSWVML